MVPSPSLAPASALAVAVALARALRWNPWLYLVLMAIGFLGSSLFLRQPGGFQHPAGATLFLDCGNPLNFGPRGSPDGSCTLINNIDNSLFQAVFSYMQNATYYIWRYHEVTQIVAGRTYYKKAQVWRANKSVADINDLGVLGIGVQWFHDPFFLLLFFLSMPGYFEALPILQPTLPSLPAFIMPTTAPTPGPAAPFQTVRGPSASYAPGRNKVAPNPLEGRQLVLIVRPGAPVTATEGPIPRSEQK